MTGYLVNADQQPTGAIYTVKNNSNTEYHPNIGLRIQSEKMDTLMLDIDKLYMEGRRRARIWCCMGIPVRSRNLYRYLYATDDVNPYLYVLARTEGWKVESPTANETISANDFSIRAYSDRIAVQSASPVRQIELFDISGRLAGTIRGANELPVDGLADGVYIVRVTTDEGVQTERSSYTVKLWPYTFMTMKQYATASCFSPSSGREQDALFSAKRQQRQQRLQALR